MTGRKGRSRRCYSPESKTLITASTYECVAGRYRGRVRHRGPAVRLPGHARLAARAAVPAPRPGGRELRRAASGTTAPAFDGGLEPQPGPGQALAGTSTSCGSPLMPVFATPTCRGRPGRMPPAARRHVSGGALDEALDGPPPDLSQLVEPTCVGKTGHARIGRRRLAVRRSVRTRDGAGELAAAPAGHRCRSARPAVRRGTGRVRGGTGAAGPARRDRGCGAWRPVPAGVRRSR